MTKGTSNIVPICAARRPAGYEANAHRLGRATPGNLADVIAEAWMRAIYHSIFPYVVAGSVVRNNAEAIAAGGYALAPKDARYKSEEKRSGSAENVDAPSVGDLLASDRRSIACTALGSAFEGDLTKSLRRDLILASSVVC